MLKGLEEATKKAEVDEREEGEEASETEDPESGEVADLASMYTELLDKRMAWQLETKHAVVNFKTAVLGGKWTMTHKNRPFDCIKASPRGKGPIAWMKRYFHDQSASFSYNLYGDRLASHLALHWCSIMEHYDQICTKQPGPEYVFLAEDTEGKPSAVDLLRYLDDVPLTHPAHERYTQVRDLQPRIQ